MRDYFTLVNNKQYQEAWTKLSADFQNQSDYNGQKGYDGYVAFWSTVNKVDIVQVQVTSLSDTEALVYTEINFHYKGGTTATGHTTYKLIRDPYSNSWLIDPS